MGDSRTIKVQYNGDIRRFAVDGEKVKYEDVVAQISSFYSLPTVGLTLRYRDDEGDMISLTSTAELIEALRLSKLETPPILRLFVSSTAKPEASVNPPPQTTPVPTESKPVDNNNNVQITEPQIEEKQYAPLSPSEWDAPKKQSQPEPKVVESRPLTIAQDMNNHCMDTLQDVKTYSSGAVAEMHLNTAAVIASLKLPTVMESVFEVSDLSKEIADACKELSRQTAEISEAVSKLTLSQSLHESDQSRENVNSNSKDTLKMTEQFSNETMQMLAKQSQEALEKVESLKEQSARLAELSRTTAEMGTNLSKETLNSGNNASSEILSKIKEM
eukprot:TRINITY_DN4824_c0_g1_i2.p1 TRINITY_DN4824_c0_g1~~TRINITY_DN4824_c0_g1_i2.p1  ORF type:complete len:352 (+),score=97.91 TRINITY_DN4824_c0_g1_i2:68-1057(+)